MTEMASMYLTEWRRALAGIFFASDFDRDASAETSGFDCGEEKSM